MQSEKPNRRRCFVYACALLVILLVMTEGLVRLGAAFEIVRIRSFSVSEKPERITFLGDINPHFGVWHVPNASVAVPAPRRMITYESNEYGMRDRPRNVSSSAPERVVVLGDSFIEGVYVEEADRVTDVLESKTGVEFLNFGTSGNFGSIQAWQLYKHLASRFDQTRVCLFLLPDNDFDDNDPTEHSAERYRPYLRKTNDTYEVIYPVPFEKAMAGGTAEMTTGRKARRWLYNHWFSLNLIVHRDLSIFIDPFRQHAIKSSYDTYTPEDLSRLLFTYKCILNLARPDPLYVFVIPRDEDFLAHKSGRMKGRIGAALATFAQANPGVTVVDLLPHFLAYAEEHDISYKRFFLSFDPHWSPLGHRVAADAVLKTLQKHNFQPHPPKHRAP